LCLFDARIIGCGSETVRYVTPSLMMSFGFRSLLSNSLCFLEGWRLELVLVPILRCSGTPIAKSRVVVVVFSGRESMMNRSSSSFVRSSSSAIWSLISVLGLPFLFARFGAFRVGLAFFAIDFEPMTSGASSSDETAPSLSLFAFASSRSSSCGPVLATSSSLNTSSSLPKWVRCL
jgi:hypothetical protein